MGTHMTAKYLPMIFYGMETR